MNATPGRPPAALSLAHVPFAHKVPMLHNMVTAGILVVAAALGATITFCLIEHPFLELRTAVLGKKSGGAKPGAQPPAPVPPKEQLKDSAA